MTVRIEKGYTIFVTNLYNIHMHGGLGTIKLPSPPLDNFIIT